MSEKDEDRFQSFITLMKNRVKDNDVVGALTFAKKALEIRDSEKLLKRIRKMEDYISEMQEASAEEGDDMLDLGDGFFIAKDLGEKLYGYQREGVRWLWNLFRKGKGGILGDDMGLGKTLQIISLLAGLLDLQKIKNAIIVLPLTLVANWQAEFNKWTPGIEVEDFHGLTKRQRERACEKVQRRGGIILITYGMILNNYELLAEYRGRQFVWDYVILDEGHKIKNASKTTKSVHQVPAANRLVLTGTPIQNNLLELWSLYDFVHSGTLLGTAATFKAQFSNPILKSREKCATREEKRLGEQMAELLRHRVDPFFLRRTKGEVLGHQSGDAHGTVNVPKAMAHKNDFVAWISLTDEQIKIYKECLKLEVITEVLNSKRSPLVQITILKKICDHPRLLSARMSESLGLIDDQENYFDGDKMVATQMLHKLSDKQLMQESGKLKFLIDLLGNLRAEGHKCLVFSQSRVMLDIIERILKNANFKIARIDGTVCSPSERQERIQKFEKDSSYSVFLLTTQVGGVGITLTSANRVVIYDPSWNPAQDSQAVDRVYRIGQLRSVVVYRLITCGTVEEKIYRRQVFKQSIHKQTVEKREDNICRYFSRQELRDMFTLEDPSMSKTQIQLEGMHAASRKTSIELDSHIAFLYSIPGFFGLSDHDLLFTVSAGDDEALDDVGKKHIGDWMERANKLVDLECEMTDKARAEQGKFLKPVLPESQPRAPLGMLSSRTINTRGSSLIQSSPPKNEVDELVQEVEMFSPFKPKGHAASGSSQSFTQDVNERNLANQKDDIIIIENVNNLTQSRSMRKDLSKVSLEEVVDLTTPNTSTFDVAVNPDVKLVENLKNSLLLENQDNCSSNTVKKQESESSYFNHSEPESALVSDSESENEAPLVGKIPKSESILVPESGSEDEGFANAEAGPSGIIEPMDEDFVNAKASPSGVIESMDVSLIENAFPELPKSLSSVGGPLNSTRFSSIFALGKPLSEDEKSVNSMDESYHSVQSDNGHVMEVLESLAPSPSSPEGFLSPLKDRVKASKLRRSSMFIRVANEVEDEDSYSESGSGSDDEVESEESSQSEELISQNTDQSSRTSDQHLTNTRQSADFSNQSVDLRARNVDQNVKRSATDSPSILSPMKDRVKASKLLRSSMFHKTANEVESDSVEDESEESDQSEELSTQTTDQNSRRSDQHLTDSRQSADSSDQSADISARNVDQSNKSERSDHSSSISETESPLVVIRSAKRKYKRIVVPSDSDTD